MICQISDKISLNSIMTKYLSGSWKYQSVKYIDLINGMFISACEICDYIDRYIYKEIPKKKKTIRIDKLK
ncbi:hypothetical protein HanIR_Chr02g0092911 [Helianthus annuus]|nr:hypothetical protein HanIR_Chr02g0092911 [Helianthus annuus]